MHYTLEVEFYAVSAASTDMFGHWLQDKKQLHRDLKAAKGIKQEVQRMQADLIKSTQHLDSVAPHPSPSQGTSQALPAPQISPASPPQPTLSSS